MSWIVGSSGNYSIHDTSYALIDAVSGEVVYVGEQERLTRIRHSVGALPSSSVLKRAMTRFDVRPEAVDLVSVGCDPNLFELEYNREAFRLTEGVVLEQIGLETHPRLHFAHHLSHAASSYYVSEFPEAAILTVDGMGEKITCGIFSADGTSIVPAWEKSDGSIGNLYTRITQWLGLGYMGDEGKTMGLAPYGQPSMLDEFRRRIIDWDPEDGDFCIDASVLRGGYDVESVLGNRRRSGEPLSQRHKDVAATLQVVTEEILVGLARRAKSVTGHQNLCLAGGVALNSVSNGRIQRSGIFDRYFFAPWAGDAGLSIGAGLLGYYAQTSHPRAIWPAGNAYLGDEMREEDVLAALRRRNLPVQKSDDPALLAAELISQGAVVGWCQGRAEVGPRALGNRSILANAMVPNMAEVVNTKVKFREPWRPFAPSVLVEDAEVYFEDGQLAPYMITTDHFRDAFRTLFPSVTHVDYSGRTQTVTVAQNAHYHGLLTRLKEITGHGLVLNTSLNIKGEPIVDSADDAVEAYLTTEMDALFLGEYVLRGVKPSNQSVEMFNSQRRHLRGLELATDLSASLLVLESELDRNLVGHGRDALEAAIRNLVAEVSDLRLITDVEGSDVWTTLNLPCAPVSLESVEADPDCLGRAVFLYAEAALFGVDAQSVLRKLTARRGLPAFLLVGDRTAHAFEDVRRFSDLWRRAFLEYPPPAGDMTDAASALAHQAG